MEVEKYLINEIKVIVNNNFSDLLKNKNKIDGLIFIDKKIKLLISKISLFKFLNKKQIPISSISLKSSQITIESIDYIILSYTNKDERFTIQFNKNIRYFAIWVSNDYRQSNIYDVTDKIEAICNAEANNISRISIDELKLLSY